MDTVRGPFIKMKMTNDKPCIGGVMNATADNMCYDTISFMEKTGSFVSDGASFTNTPGRFQIDGMPVTDIPGEYYRTYPYDVDQVWPDRKMTLIVKDGEARLMVLGPDVTTADPINNYRQPTKWVSTWTYNLDALGYTGGQLGLFCYAHQLTFSDLKITDLSDDLNLPTDYCNGNATCTDGGVCTAVPVSDVCEDPVGATVIDVTTMDQFEFIQDPGITWGVCQWQISDLGRGPFLYQASNAHASLESVGCNAVYKGGSYLDFVLQFDVDNFDNDGVGPIFGWKSEIDHYKIHKRIDVWPSPSADYIEGPNFKIKKRLPDRSCDVRPQNETNNCYETVAWADNGTKDFFSHFIFL